MRSGPTDGIKASLGDALVSAKSETDLETGLAHLTRLAAATLGDADAAMRPGALRPGETSYSVSGVFLITPDTKYNMLVANTGFPAEQRRLAIPIEWNHPGQVVATRKPLLLENTDDHADFRQFLKSSRMGSSVYVPMFADGNMFGQVVVAAQARWTYGPGDLEAMGAIAAAGETVWRQLGGEAWLSGDYPAPDLWDAALRSVAS